MAMTARRTHATTISDEDLYTRINGLTGAAGGDANSINNNSPYLAETRKQLTSPHRKRPLSIISPNNDHSSRRLWMRLSILSSPRYRSVLCMSMSLTIHLAGYELSRAAVVALFTSDGLGFGHGSGGGLSALPLAVGCVSPFSVALLWFYGHTLDYGGPSYALRTHTLICGAIQIISGWILRAYDDRLQRATNDDDETFSAYAISSVSSKSRLLLFVLFIFQNGYVQLLYNQHWAFISSILTPEEGARAFAPIAGLGSIGSTLAAGLVSLLIGQIGLIGLLHLAGISFVVSALLADVAFGMAKSGGFEPKKEIAAKDHTPQSPGNIFQQARVLFRRVPVLGALFLEVVCSQCLSSLVNFIYLYKLKATILDDDARAGWSGTFYAGINGISGILQFFVIPLLLRSFEARRMWIFMPCLMLCCTLYTFVTFRSSGLLGASASFFAIKTMEYSLRGAANEMLYVSLDYESRYLGKKVISLIAGKFGKSAMAIALSLVMVVYGEEEDTMWYLVGAATVFNFLWLSTSMSLHSLIEASK